MGCGPSTRFQRPSVGFHRTMRRIVALVLLVMMTLGLAYAIEMSARPPTGRQGVRVEAGHEH